MNGRRLFERYQLVEAGSGTKGGGPIIDTSGDLRNHKLRFGAYFFWRREMFSRADYVGGRCSSSDKRGLEPTGGAEGTEAKYLGLQKWSATKSEVVHSPPR
jgi:hypothetical protein